MIKAHDLGKNAEKLAASYLQNLGYKLLAKNYRYLKAEVDLIVQKENTLVAVEVKARTIGYVLSPELAVSPKKSNYWLKLLIILFSREYWMSRFVLTGLHMSSMALIGSKTSLEKPFTPLVKML